MTTRALALPLLAALCLTLSPQEAQAGTGAFFDWIVENQPLRGQLSEIREEERAPDARADEVECDAQNDVPLQAEASEAPLSLAQVLWGELAALLD